ncbi:hypothetical protein EYF80_010344 [Liparis tanakae]|uniref:Uncharacterized protein n=1 Tax=Liparis tanakae TaxID=230148 RepID=A0A4Z2IP08_9TELE|nr:hypothetical protein EYF80_010344 [Liparis tanakae]
MEAEEEEDSHPEMKHFTLPWPHPRLRSLSDTSGFRSRVLFRLRGARSGRDKKRKEERDEDNRGWNNKGAENERMAN